MMLHLFKPNLWRIHKIISELEYKCKKTGEIYKFQMEICCNYYIYFQDSYALEIFFKEKETL